jgi:hypothetical protein
VKRSLQKGNVAEYLHEMGGRGITFQSAAMARQQNERKVGPGLLRGNPLRKIPAVAAVHGLLGKDGDAAPPRDLPSELAQVGTDKAFDVRLTQDAGSDRGVSASRRQYECALRIRWPD